MARSRFIYTLKEVAEIIGENLELIEEVSANSGNTAEGEFVYVRYGSEDGTKGLTENGTDDFEDFLADIRSWDGGIRQFLVDDQCDPEMIERFMTDEMQRLLKLRPLHQAKVLWPYAHGRSEQPSEDQCGEQPQSLRRIYGLRITVALGTMFVGLSFVPLAESCKGRADD